MTTPRRIQRKRTRGWRMPAGAVYVGRPTKWGNPYRIGHYPLTAQRAVDLYRRWLAGEQTGARRPPSAEFLEAIRTELRGRDLVCWCPLDRPCHADVLLELANR